MAIPDPPPDPTHFRVLLTDPEGSDKVEIQRLLEDCGLEVLGVEELSSRDGATDEEAQRESYSTAPRGSQSWITPQPHCSFAYSALACFRMGMSGSASFQRLRKSR